MFKKEDKEKAISGKIVERFISRNFNGFYKNCFGLLSLSLLFLVQCFNWCVLELFNADW